MSSFFMFIFVGSLLIFIFIFRKRDSHSYNKMEYYYDDMEEYSDDITIYRKHNKRYTNDSFDGGESNNEKDYELYKASDIF